MMRLARGQKFLALFASGSLLPLSLAPFYYWPIAILCIAVLFRTLQYQTVEQALVKSAVFGFGMFFAGVSWVYVSIHDHGFIPAPLALIATTLFCLFIALLFALPFALSALIPATLRILAYRTTGYLGFERMVSQLDIDRLPLALQRLYPH